MVLYCLVWRYNETAAKFDCFLLTDTILRATARASDDTGGHVTLRRKSRFIDGRSTLYTKLCIIVTCFRLSSGGSAFTDPLLAVDLGSSKTDTEREEQSRVHKEINSAG